MDNIQFEINRERTLMLLAKQLNVPVEQVELKVDLSPEDSDYACAVTAVVRVDLATANKIDKKIKRLEGGGSEE